VIRNATGELAGQGVTPGPGGFFDNLEAWFQRERTTAQGKPLPFLGGWLVYLGYEVAAEIESPAVTPVDAHKRAAVLAGSYARDDRVSPAERAAIEFCEVYAMDAQAITDGLAAAVVEHVGEPGLVALIEALGFIDGRMRLARMLGPLFQEAN